MPSDPLLQWSHHSVNISREAIEDVLSSGWGDLRVGHVDTGIRPCAVLGDWVLWHLGANLIEPGAEPIPAVKPSSGSGLDKPMPQHGTRTSTALCGYRHQTFCGIAPRLPIIPIRAQEDVILDSKEEQDRIGRAILHAIDRDCRVVTISMGVPLFLNGAGGILGHAVDAAYENGVIVCAAGGQGYGAVCYPGKFYRAIAVGGYVKAGPDGAYARYSGYNNADCIDCWGPAKPILRADGERIFDDASLSEDDDLGKGDGTSYATPHVAAAAAYWLRHHGQALTEAYGRTWRLVEAFRLLLKSTAVQTQGFGFAVPHGGDTPFGDQTVRVPQAGEEIPRKGMTAADGWGISGRLNIDGLVASALPAVSALRYEDRLARDQHQ